MSQIRCVDCGNRVDENSGDVFKCSKLRYLKKANRKYDIEIKNITKERLVEILKEPMKNHPLRKSLKQSVTREGLRYLFSLLLWHGEHFTTQDSKGGWTFDSRLPYDKQGNLQDVKKHFCEWKEMNPKDELKSPKEHGTLYITVTS